jgi:hypothetical protein
MKQHHPILSDVETYLAKSGMSDTYFGKKAVGNSELVARLREGGGLHFTTEARVRGFISANPPSAHNKSGNTRAAIQGGAV